MNAHALITREDRSFRIEPVRLPEPGPDQISVRTLYSGVSIGTEFALIRQKISWGPFPICTGYMGTGVVETVGTDVTGFVTGDRVWFRGNQSMSLPDGSAVSCTSGGHASHVVVKPDTSHGAGVLHPAADPETASMFVMPAVGLYGVDMANPRMGQAVVVYGCGLIGLGVVAACVHRGCKVIAVDLETKRLAIASELGAEVLVDASREDVKEVIRERTGGGSDVVFECTGLPQCIDDAIELCRPFGSFVWQGNYGSEPVSMHFLTPHGKRLTMFFPCDDGLDPCRRAVIRNMALGALRWERCITHRITSKEAPQLFARIDSGEPDVIGVTIRWSDE